MMVVCGAHVAEDAFRKGLRKLKWKAPTKSGMGVTKIGNPDSGI